MFSSPLVRLAIGIPAAIIISIALFLLMERPIRIDEVTLETNSSRGLRNIFAEKSTLDNVRSTRKSIDKMNKAKKPPPPPKMFAGKTSVDLPKANISGATPTEIKFERVTNIDVGAVSVNDRDAQPIKPPNIGPIMRKMEQVGKSAECEVSLDVDVNGKPFNVHAKCNVSSYESAAEASVKQAEFAPKTVKGQRVERRGVVYPFELRMDE